MWIIIIIVPAVEGNAVAQETLFCAGTLKQTHTKKNKKTEKKQKPEKTEKNKKIEKTRKTKKTEKMKNQKNTEKDSTLKRVFQKKTKVPKKNPVPILEVRAHRHW